ncbi:hypothetical protein QCA50_013641 [Cerrena zonata]|uniref:Uncharacterized protein n=1 Tax=Cerrena zonata TaxID=2478898 RepID=A0AAW0FYW5_9APHY
MAQDLDIAAAVLQATQDPFYVGNTEFLSRGSWHTVNGLSTYVVSPGNGDSELSPAPVTFVCTLSGEGFKMGPEGNFSPTYRQDTPLAKSKMSAMGEAGFNEHVRAVFPNVLAGFSAIQGSKKTDGGAPSNLIVKPNTGKIRIRHATFKLVELAITSNTMLTQGGTPVSPDVVPPATDSSGSGGKAGDSTLQPSSSSSTGKGTKDGKKVAGGPSTRKRTAKEAETPAADSDSSNTVATNASTVEEDKDAAVADVDDPFDLRNWPYNTEEMKEDLEEMIDSGRYEVVPLPALDVDDSIILPSQYEEKLKGAIVRVTVTIVHQYLRTGKTDNFYADIQEIKVLKKPLRVLASPGKRKFDEQLRQAKRGRTA